MRDIDKLTFVEPAVREAQKEKFMCLLHEVERKRTDLLPEHQEIPKRSQKLRSLQDKKKPSVIRIERKDEDVAKLEHASRPFRRIRVKAEGLQAKWKTRFGSCKLERNGEEVVRRSQTDAVGIRRCWSSSLPLERHKQQVLSNTRSKSSPNSAEIQVFQSRRQEQKRR